MCTKDIATLFPNLPKCHPSVFHAEDRGKKYRFECRGDASSACSCMVYCGRKKILDIADVYILRRPFERFLYEDILRKAIDRFIPHIAGAIRSQIIGENTR